MIAWIPRRSMLLKRVLPLVALLGLGAAAWFWFATPDTGPDRQASVECREARRLADKLQPLAKGEVAALVPSSVAKQPPEIMFQGPEGQPLTLANLKGKALLVNLWATWCVPCRQEMPALDKLQSALGGQDFEVVAINVDTRNIEKPKAWLQETGIHNLAFYADPSGKLLQVLQRSGHVVGLPTTLMVDAAGCEIALMKGPADWASPDALALVKAALGRPS